MISTAFAGSLNGATKTVSPICGGIPEESGFDRG
jgi:hypothetical protein